MSNDPNDGEWLAVPDVAGRLGVSASRVREMLRTRRLLAVRRGDNTAWYVPAGFIIDGNHQPHVLPTLRGTLTLLGDAGLSDDEAMEWLLEPDDELGCSPLEALREGRRRPVRRIAQMLF